MGRFWRRWGWGKDRPILLLSAAVEKDKVPPVAGKPWNLSRSRRPKERVFE